MSIRKILLTTSFCALLPMAAFAQSSMSASMSDPMVGGSAMYPSKNIVQNAVNSNDHTTLVAAVKAAGLVSTLEGPGPFTVFAPTNEAFAKLPPGTVTTLLKPENKARADKNPHLSRCAGPLHQCGYSQHDQCRRRQGNTENR